MSIAQQSMGLALGGLRRLAGLEIIDRFGQRERVENLIRTGVGGGFGAATAAARNFSAVQKKLAGPSRQKPVDPERRKKALFDLTPSEEQQMLVDAFTDVAADVLRPNARKGDDACEAPKEVLETVAAMGTTVLGVPADLGGVMDERSSVTTMLAAATLAHGDMGLAAAALAPGSVATALSLWGTAEQQGRYLPAFTGDDAPVATLAVMENRALFDATDLHTSATRTGDGFVLSGEKSMVLRASEAELFLVAANLVDENSDGTPSLFLVESGLDGLTVTPEPTMGVRAGGGAFLHLQEVVVPATSRLGGDEWSADDYAEMVARARLAWAALAVGTGQAVLDYVIPYVNEREAFGEPISHRQAVAFMVADIAIELDGLRLVALRGASLADMGKDIRTQAALARQLTATKGMQIGNDGVQLLGGHGYVKEHPVERWYRDLRAAGIVEGALLV